MHCKEIDEVKVKVVAPTQSKFPRFLPPVRVRVCKERVERQASRGILLVVVRWSVPQFTRGS